jgi:hypothetical protein
MINTSYKLHWRGPQYEARLQKEMSQAIRTAAGKVRNAAVNLLNVSGRAATKDLNKQTGKAFKGLTATEKNDKIYQDGLGKIDGLKTVKSGKKALKFGGSAGGVSRIYWYGSPVSRWVTASEPGTPPHKQSEMLKQISIETARGGMSAKVGPRYGLIYARIQELGGKGMVNLAPRPYMRPAFISCLPEIQVLIQTAIVKAGKK